MERHVRFEQARRLRKGTCEYRARGLKCELDRLRRTKHIAPPALRAQTGRWTVSGADVGAVSHSPFEWLRSFLRSSVGVMRPDGRPGARISLGDAPRYEPTHAAVR
jgi:hypothetical protein